jgi:hypothetical protein
MSATPPIDISYELTQDDLAAFQWRANYDSSGARRSRRMSYVYLFAVLAILLLLPAIGGNGFTFSLPNLVFLLMPFLVVAALTWIFHRRMLRAAIRKLVEKEKPGKSLIGGHRIVIDADGITETTAVGEARVQWSGIDRVEQDSGYVYIYTSAAGAYVVPKRAFNSASDAEAFYDVAATSARHAAL